MGQRVQGAGLRGMCLFRRPIGTRLKPEFAVRTKTYQIECIPIGSPVDENQIGFDMAISVISPFSDQGMVMMALRQRLVVGEHGYDIQQSLSIVFRCRPFFSRL